MERSRLDKKYELYAALGAMILAFVLLAAAVFLILQQVRISNLNREVTIAKHEMLYMTMIGKKLTLSGIGQVPGQTMRLEVTGIKFDKNGAPTEIRGNLWVDPYPSCTYAGNHAYKYADHIGLLWKCGAVSLTQNITLPYLPDLGSVRLAIESVVTN